MSLRRVAVIAVGLIAALIVAELVTSGGGSKADQAPELPGEVLVGPRVTLDSLRGDVAIVNFWASWCDPCKREAPEFAVYGRDLPDGIRLVGVNWDDARGSARAFIKRYHWRFPNLRDGSDEAGARFGLTGLPATFVIDRKGRIAETLRGPQTVAEISAAARKVASE
jgi:cytochrome c biogenesis protein CcmG, thiol:disulfide interchange protein DsbE